MISKAYIGQCVGGEIWSSVPNDEFETLIRKFIRKKNIHSIPKNNSYSSDTSHK